MEKRIIASAELMDDYKRMSVAMPEKKMRVSSGEKTLYSIGNDGNLYLLQENIEEHKGWEKINLTKDLDKLCKASSFEVTTFDVQNREQGTIAVFAAKCDGKNILFYSESAQRGKFVWNPVSGGEDKLSGTEVAALYLSVFEKELSAICDLKKDGRITRYFLDLKEEAQVWKKQELPADFSTTRQSVAGRAGKTKVDGIYTLGRLAGEPQLLYTPFYNRFNREIPPLSMRFSMEKPLDAIAVLPGEDGKNTNLFACGGGCLCLYPAEEQKDLCRPVVLAESKEFQNVSSFGVHWGKEELVVSGIGREGNLFLCRASKEDWRRPGAWQEVSVIASGMLHAECIWNKATGKETVFGVCKDGKHLQMLEQSKQTGLWSTGSIRIPALEGPAKKIPSYVTRIRVEEDGTFCPGQTVMLSAENTCNVYINEQYYILDKTPQEIRCDEAGVLRVVEEAAGLYGTEIHVELEGSKKRICPSKEPMQRLFELDTPEKLQAARVEGEPLVGKDCTGEQLKAIAQTLDSVGKHEATKKLWEQGVGSPVFRSVKRKNLTHVSLQEHQADTVQIRLSFGGGTLQGISEEKNCRFMSVPGSGVCAMDAETVSSDGWDVIYTTAAEFFRKLRSLGGKIFEVAVSCVKEIWSFTVQAGKKIYTFVMDTLEKLGAGLLKLLEYIKVGVEKLIKYVKYLFDWEDIKRVAKALEGAVLNGFGVFERGIAQCQGEVHKLTEMITSALDRWAEIEHHDVTKDSLTGRSQGEMSFDVRQSYLADYSRQNLPFSDVKEHQEGSFLDAELERLKGHMQNIFDFLETEGVILDDFMKKIRDELLDTEKLKSMNFGEICKKILVIIADATIYTLENILYSLLEVVKILAAQIKRVLAMPIHIPVLSDILKEVFGIEEKSILEIGCLILSTATVPILKLCGQGELFREEVFACIENFEVFEAPPKKSAGLALNVQQMEKMDESVLKNEEAGLPVSKTKRDAFAVLHIICGIANFFETFTAVKNQTKLQKVEAEGGEGAGESFSIWDGADAVLSVIDGCCYCTAFMLYQPCQLRKTNWIWIFNFIFACLKYGGLVCKLAYRLSGFLMEHIFSRLGEAMRAQLGSFLGSGKLEKTGELCNAIGAAVLILGNTFYMTMGTEGKSKEEKELLYLDCSSLIGDNLRIVLDNIIPHVEDPNVKTGCIVGRAFFSVSYSALQIAEGADALGMKCQ